MDKWISLASELNLLNEPHKLEVSSDKDILALEKEIGFKLPEDYKSYCKVFGSGSFGRDWINVYATKIENVKQDLTNRKSILDAYKMRADNDYSEGHISLECSSKVIEILERGYIFGFAQQILFVFTSQVSESCKIHAIDDDLEFFDFGYDFFDFVKNCCLGKRIEREFPKLMDFMIPLDYSPEQVMTLEFNPIGF